MRFDGIAQCGLRAADSFEQWLPVLWLGTASAKICRVNTDVPLQLSLVRNMGYADRSLSDISVHFAAYISSQSSAYEVSGKWKVQRYVYEPTHTH